MPLYIAKSGDLDRCYRCLTHSQTKDSATQLLTKYKSGALVTQSDRQYLEYIHFILISSFVVCFLLTKLTKVCALK